MDQFCSVIAQAFQVQAVANAVFLFSEALVMGQNLLEDEINAIWQIALKELTPVFGVSPANRPIITLSAN
jgi:hypothetical protein